MEMYEIAQHLANMKYKPGVKFGVRDGYKGTTEIWIVAEVKDATHNPTPGAKNSIYPTIPLNMVEVINLAYVVTLADLKRTMRYLFEKLENHEIDEWFKYNGEWVNDPHPDRYNDLD